MPVVVGLFWRTTVFQRLPFFPYCTDLLERYADVEKVFTISGYTDIKQHVQMANSYQFSNYFSCWGWATWNRAWQHYDPELSGYRNPNEWSSIVHRLRLNVVQRLYWKYIFSRVLSGKTASWAYRFQLSIWQQSGLAITPAVNLIENIGFNEAATNTAGLTQFAVAKQEMEFPLRHPKDIRADRTMDRWIEDHWHSKSLVVRMRWALMKLKAALCVSGRSGRTVG